MGRVVLHPRKNPRQHHSLRLRLRHLLQPVAAPSGEVASKADSEFPAGVKATPVARRIAAENNVDLLQVPFEGERIRKADVEAFIAAGGAIVTQASTPASAPAAQPMAEAQLATAGQNDTAVPASRLRQAIARRMTESKQTVPHFQVTMDIDMAPAMALRKQVNGMLEAEGIKVSVNDVIVKAAGVALKDFPSLNASFGGDQIIQHHDINVGSGRRHRQWFARCRPEEYRQITFKRYRSGQ